MKNLKYILIFTAILLIISVLYRFLGNKNIESIETPQLIENTNSQLTKVEFLNQKIDLGRVKGDKLIETEFILINKGNSKLVIDHVEVSCDCTAGEIMNEFTNPGDSLKIRVMYNKIRYGFFYQDVMVYGNFETSPQFVSFEGFIID
ncbi:DUF1573 domain-containing protein [Peijinzhouia sedimentorum]